MWRVAIALVTVLVSGIAYSSEHPNLKSAKTQSSADSIQRGSDEKPLTVKILPSETAKDEAAQTEKHRKEKSVQDQELVDATIFLGKVTIALAFFTFLLWVATYRLASETKKTAAQQAKDMQASLSIAQQSAHAALLTAQSMQFADRAYIKISHMPPGLIFNDSLADRLYANVRTGTVVIDVSNIGKTPARITAFVKTSFILLHNEPLPPLPPYEGGAIEQPEVRTTMYGTDAMTPSFRINLSADELTAIHTKTSRLYLLIYADYIDQFGIRHRAGYARRYDPQSPNNLLLVTQRDYNYDIQRQPNQGNDWDEPQT